MHATVKDVMTTEVVAVRDRLTYPDTYPVVSGPVS
jgi:hypothetical protein